MNPFQPWATVKQALSAGWKTDPGQHPAVTATGGGPPPCHIGATDGTACDSDHSALMGFSSTCYYYGESLYEELSKGGAPPPPIGMVHTSFGGSRSAILT